MAVIVKSVKNVNKNAKNKNVKNRKYYIVISLAIFVCLLVGISGIIYNNNIYKNYNNNSMVTNTNTDISITTITVQNRCTEFNYSEMTISNKESYSEYKDLIKNDTDCTINELKNEFTSLKSEINEYSIYRDQKSKVEDYFNKIKSYTFYLIVRLRKYDSSAARLLLNGEDHLYDKYDDLDNLYTYVDDSVKKIEDEIYDELYKDLNDFYCENMIKNQDGIISDSEYGTAYYSCTYLYQKARTYTYSTYYDIDLDNLVLYGNLKSNFYKDSKEDSLKSIVKFEDGTDSFIEMYNRF